jgi:hypothetical protein
MKQEHEYIETSIWYREEITDPYQVIAEFFSHADVASHRKTIRDAIKAACSDRVWSKRNPGDLLFDFKLLESVINAAYLLNKEKKKSPLTISQDKLFDPNLYCGWHGGMTEWDFFPRMLSLKEYIDPYLVFKRFFKFLKLAEWKRELSDVAEYALGTTSLWEAGIDFNTLPIYFHLTKLVEAAHLIDVREITHVGGYIKNRYKRDV